jgi:hypothetical protein
MTTRYFGLNTLAGAKRSSTAVADGDTTAGRFDSAYVASAIKVTNLSDFLEIGQPFIDGSTSISGTFWFRLDWYATANPSAGNTMALFLNGAANAYRVQCTSGSTFQLQYWNSGTSAWVNWGSTFSAAGSTLFTFAIKLVVNSAFEVYQGGTLVASSAVVPTNGAAAFTKVQLSATNGTAYFSQLMGADYDIRDSHLFSKLPSANGNYTDGTGTAADVGETVLDDGTAISLPAVGNKHTFTKPATASLPSGLTIAGLLANVRGRVGGGTVTDGKIKCRSSSTDSTTAGKGFVSGYEPRGHFFATDPATGTTWGKTAIDNSEVGLEAA